MLAWIVIGAVVGWRTGRVFQGNGYGPLMDILMGIGGGVGGGFMPRESRGSTLITSGVAMVSAVVLTALAVYINGRRIYARQL